MGSIRSDSRVFVLVLATLVIISIVILAVRPAVAQQFESGEPCTRRNPALFDIVETPAVLDAVILKLLDRSSTFREQCRRIIAAHRLHLVVRIVVPIAMFPVRTTMKQSPSGWLEGLVDLAPVPGRYAEWLGHEFEHVVEHLDGIRIRELAQHGDGAYEVTAGLFETVRAARTGDRVAREFRARTPKAVVVRRFSEKLKPGFRGYKFDD